MDIDTLRDLVTAFTYKQSLDRNFYWKKETEKIIEVSIFDYSLISDDKDNYTSGLDPEEEREVKEAIIAHEKNRNTHITIPRIEIKDRIALMQSYISQILDREDRIALEQNLNDIIQLSKGDMQVVKKGFRPGFAFDDLVYKNEKLKQSWYDYYYPIVKDKALSWLIEINNAGT
jgi:hypothetical protein